MRFFCPLTYLTDKHGVHFAQEMSGNVSIKEMFRYAKPSQEEMQSTIEALFESWFWFSADRMKVNFASDRLITYTDHESKATPHIHSGAKQGCRAYDK